MEFMLAIMMMDVGYHGVHSGSRDGRGILWGTYEYVNLFFSETFDQNEIFKIREFKVVHTITGLCVAFPFKRIDVNLNTKKKYQ